MGATNAGTRVIPTVSDPWGSALPERYGLGPRGFPEPGLWGIVLAGGDGERFKEFAAKLYGYPRAKQYCTIVGTRSMIQHTLDRAEFLIPPGRVVVVVNRDHEKEVREQLASRPPGTVLFQPQNRDTAAGVLFPLIWIARRTPDATVVVLPSDHFVLEEGRFMAYVLWAKRLVDRDPGMSILLGVDAEAPETGYGWIEPEAGGQTGGAKVVKSFYEKPEPALAEELYIKGCLWNTLVLVSKARTLLNMYKSYLLELYYRFQWIAAFLGTAEEGRALEEAYASMPAVNISSGVLQKNPPDLRTLRVSGVLWSDWGSPKRVRQTLRRLGRQREITARLVKGGFDRQAVPGKTEGPSLANIGG
jgi:mannose-1-phosphate guanylyltransferase